MDLDIRKFCTPAQLYLLFAIFHLFAQFMVNFRFMTLVINSLFVVVWAWILNWICSKGYGVLSWVLVLLPFVFFAAAFALAMDAEDAKDKLESPPKKEGMGCSKKK